MPDLTKKNKKSNKKQNKLQNKNKNKKNNKNKTSMSMKSQKIDPYDPSMSLTGKSLKKFVQSQVKSQIKPQIGSAKRLAKALQKNLAAQTEQQRGLTNQTQQNIGGYYGNVAGLDQQAMARQQAIGARLTGEVGAAGSQATQQVGAASGAALERLSADEALRRGAPSSARDELQGIIAQQQGNVARESASQNATASNRSADWQSMLGMMQGATQMQGGYAVTEAGKAGRNRVTDLQMQYAPDIIEALGNVKDIKSTKGGLKNQILGETIERERQYGLSKGALGLEKKELKASTSGKNSQMKLAKQYAKNKKKEQLRGLKNQLKVIQAQSGAKAAEQARSLEAQIRVLERQASNKAAEQKGSQKLINSQSGGAGGKTKVPVEEMNRARDTVRRLSSDGTLNLDAINTKVNYQDAVAGLVSRYGVTGNAARKYLLKVTPWGKQSKKGRKTNTDYSSINALLNG